MSRMVRILKVIKEKNKISKFISDIIPISATFERLFFFLLIFFTLIHVCSCMFIFTAHYDKSQANWIEDKGYSDYSAFELYITSMYFTVTTITTVGYGDISAQNTAERIFCVFLMLLGVISFSFSTGSLSSVMSSYDASQASYREKLTVLTEIHSKYNISQNLHDEIKKLIKFDIGTTKN